MIKMTQKCHDRKGNSGYTIDQTILIVAIIAILITIIIATVGWDLINKTGGAKLASQLRQMEDASSQFYSQHRMWPPQAINAPVPTTSVAHGEAAAFALTGQDNSGGNVCGAGANAFLDWSSSIVCGDRRSLVGYRNDGSDTLIHDLSGGDNTDVIRLHARKPHANTGLNIANTFLIVEFIDVPAPEVLQADESIDGDDTDPSDVANPRANQGRVIFVEAGGAGCAGGGAANGAIGNGAKDICYIANLID